MISNGLRDLFLMATILHLDAAHAGTLLDCQDSECFETALDLMDLLVTEQRLNRVREGAKVA